MIKKYSINITTVLTVEANTAEQAMNIAHQFYSGAEKLDHLSISVYEKPSDEYLSK